jgi:outer membrane lipoprotein LolB
MRRPLTEMRCWLLACAALLLVGCKTAAIRPTSPLAPWALRAATLAQAQTWQLDGRAAAALGEQGWQASLDWRQSGNSSEVHLAGPLGIGALVLDMSPAGLALNGAPPSPAVAAQLEARLGFALPLDNLRFWLLGIPNPDAPFELTRNAMDRAQHLSQAGWSIDYDQYRPQGDDQLPARIVLSRADARVRIAVDRWQGPQ